MEHTWSKINGFSNYSVSNIGEVRNDRTRRIKTPKKTTDGYYAVDLYTNGERSTKRVHRLVADAFIKNEQEKPQINHIDGNKLNNDCTNLEWVSAKENMRHAVVNGLYKPSCGMKGKKNPNAGRHGKKVRIVETGEVFDSIRECEIAIDGNNRHISDCLSGRQMTHRGYHFEYA